MAKYRKKPVVIEAVQNTAEFRKGEKTGSVPSWIVAHLAAEVIRPHPTVETALSIGTLEGTMRADDNDWIIQGVNGEVYPCKPDIFAATYEAVEG